MQVSTQNSEPDALLIEYSNIRAETKKQEHILHLLDSQKSRAFHKMEHLYPLSGFIDLSAYYYYNAAWGLKMSFQSGWFSKTAYDSLCGDSNFRLAELATGVVLFEDYFCRKIVGTIDEVFCGHQHKHFLVYTPDGQFSDKAKEFILISQ